MSDRFLKNGGIDWESRIVATFHKLSRIPYADPETGLANEEWILTHAEFHKALAQGCTCRWLLKIRSSLYTQAERYRQFSGIVRDASRDVNAEHKGLMDAALSRDQQLVASRIEDHFTTTTNVILAHLGGGEWPTNCFAGDTQAYPRYEHFANPLYGGTADPWRELLKLGVDVGYPCRYWLVNEDRCFATVCVPKIRFWNIDGEGRQGQVVRRRRRGAQSREGEGGVLVQGDRGSSDTL